MSKEIVSGFVEMLKDINITKQQLNAITHFGEIIEFKSKFMHKPDPKNKYEFPIDEEISNKIESWKEYFMSYLIEKYKDYKKEGVSPPKEIIKYTLEHQKDCDKYVEFIDKYITP